MSKLCVELWQVELLACASLAKQKWLNDWDHRRFVDTRRITTLTHSKHRQVYEAAVGQKQRGYVVNSHEWEAASSGSTKNETTVYPPCWAVPLNPQLSVFNDELIQHPSLLNAFFTFNDTHRGRPHFTNARFFSDGTDLIDEGVRVSKFFPAGLEDRALRRRLELVRPRQAHRFGRPGGSSDRTGHRLKNAFSI